MATQAKNKFNWKFLLILPIFALFMVGLSACSGSAKLEGTYYAQNRAKFDSKIKIEKDKITFDGETHDYKQVSVGKKNGITYYGLKIKGTTYAVIFPDSDKDVAMLTMPKDADENMLYGRTIYVMNKKEKPDFEKYEEKYLEHK